MTLQANVGRDLPWRVIDTEEPYDFQRDPYYAYWLTVAPVAR